MKEDKLNIIDEQDLFYYIFSPESISVEQKKIIKADKSFEDILEFYRQLKTDAENRPDDSIKRKIAEKIPAYSVLNTIRLYALKDAIVSNHKVNHLAAGSTELKQRWQQKPFSTKDEVVKNFDIVIEPHNLKYHFEDNTEPLKIDKLIEAGKIEITFV